MTPNSSLRLLIQWSQAPDSRGERGFPRPWSTSIVDMHFPSHSRSAKRDKRVLNQRYVIKRMWCQKDADLNQKDVVCRAVREDLEGTNEARRLRAPVSLSLSLSLSLAHTLSIYLSIYLLGPSLVPLSIYLFGLSLSIADSIYSGGGSAWPEGNGVGRVA